MVGVLFDEQAPEPFDDARFGGGARSGERVEDEATGRGDEADEPAHQVEGLHGGVGGGAVVAVDASILATSNAVAEVAALVDGVRTVVNGVEGVGYIRGYMLDFGVSGVEANTNTAATIVRYDHGVSNDVAREALSLGAAKLPIKTKFVTRLGLEA